MYLISNDVLPTSPGPNRHTLNLNDVLLKCFTNKLRFLCFGSKLLINQPKQGEIFQIIIVYFYSFSYLYFVTFTIYNFLKAKMNRNWHSKDK